MEKYIKLMEEMIKCRPVSDDISSVNRAADILLRTLTGNGIDCMVEEISQRKTIFAVTEKGNKFPDVLLSAHIDVVPAVCESQYTPQYRDGRMYARGASDCLGHASCIAAILSALKGRASVGAIFSTDEEKEGKTAGEMLRRGYGASKCVLVLDGGDENWSITYRQKGVLILKLTAKGRGGHASEPWLFDNPVNKLMKGYLALCEKWENPVGADDWRNSIAACRINAGAADNQIPDQAEMVVNIRYTVPGETEKIIRFVREITGFGIEAESKWAPASCDTGAFEIRLLKKTFEDHLGHPVYFNSICGATDAGHLSTLNVPTAIAGAVCRGCHSSEEYMDLESLQKLRDMLIDYILRLQNTSENM